MGRFAPASVSLSSLSAHSLSHTFSSSRSTILYVDQDAVGQGDGTSWVNAYTDLGKALQSEVDFQEVWVAEGTYLPGEVRTDTFILPPNIQVYGGFSGNETARIQRDSHLLVDSFGDLGCECLHRQRYHVVSRRAQPWMGLFCRIGMPARTNRRRPGKRSRSFADGIAFMISNCTFSRTFPFGRLGSLFEGYQRHIPHCVFNNFTDSTEGQCTLRIQCVLRILFLYSNQAHYYGGGIHSDSSVLDLHLLPSLPTKRHFNGGGRYMKGELSMFVLPLSQAISLTTTGRS